MHGPMHINSGSALESDKHACYMCGCHLAEDDMWRRPEITALRSDGDTSDT